MELVSSLCRPNQGHNDVFAMKIPGPICAQNGCYIGSTVADRLLLHGSTIAVLLVKMIPIVLEGKD